MSHDPPPPRGGPSGLPPGRPPRPRPGDRRPVTPPPFEPEEVTQISSGTWDEPSVRRPPTPPAGQPRAVAPRGPEPGADTPSLSGRLTGDDRPFQGRAVPHRRAPRPGPMPAEATRYTNAFSGSLPPPPGPNPPRPGPPPGPPPGVRPAPPPRPRPDDPPTEVIAPVRDAYDDAYDDEFDDEHRDEDDRAEPPPPPQDSAGRKTVRAVGELLITAGLVILLFVVYEVYVTDLISAGKQDDATHALDDEWGANTVEPTDEQRQAKHDLIAGQAFAKMYIPVFGPDYKFSVVEGTTDKDLEIGPGHYPNTALPGSPGNFAVAGHRVGKGAPFNDLDLLNSCDAVVVETRTDWFVYRMLPKSSEVAGWAQTEKSTSPRCAEVAPLGGSYDKTVGQEIVLPSQGEVINAVPHFAGTAPEAQQAALMTLTTCHPRFSDKQRLIVHAVLTQAYPKAPGFVPEELKEQ
ncbi:class E sortase [Actinosynnema sp. NPDC023587]|uniref:class E sortase n=1 Tax=Actinosynnema sp. NPDC023587 TaxID=3154695 RepID=UPI0033D36D30